MRRNIDFAGRFVGLASAFLVACGQNETPRSRDTGDAQASAACDRAEARVVVERFGEQLRKVSLLAPDSLVRRQLREAYAPFVTTSLLDVWVATPDRAPGRKVSSPWPERIVIDTVEQGGAHTCRVEGRVIYASSSVGSS